MWPWLSAWGRREALGYQDLRFTPYGRIEAIAAVAEVIEPPATIEVVVVMAAEQEVIAPATIEVVVALVAKEEVTPLLAQYDVEAFATESEIVAFA